MPAHRPGQPVKRTWENYNPYQEACWQAVDTVYQAYYFGYIDTRQPTPGKSVLPAEYQRWREKFEAAWAQEAKRDQATRGLTGEELGESAMRHLYERFSRAETLRQQTYKGGLYL